MTVFSEAQTLIWTFLCVQIHFCNYCSGSYYLQYPKHFIFATGTGAYQVEGAWNASGKGESIWDRLVHTNPELIIDRTNGDVASDSYHRYREDVRLIKEIGFKVYRFSISWSRILPDGTLNYINQAGIDYYMNLIDELKKNGIEPLVVLYHWDLPQALQDKGGWLNDSIVHHFANYSELIFRTYGDKVKWWITFNEPSQIADGYGRGPFPPRLNLHGYGEYIVGHNLLKAHAKAYNIYKKYYKKKQKGKISMSIFGFFAYPKTNSKDNRKAAERAMQFHFGWFAHPLYSTNGDYPPVMRKYINENSAKEKLKKSRLPYFTKKEIEEIKGSFDFLALNHLTSKIAEKGTCGPRPSSARDSRVILSDDPSWPSSACPWQKVVPEGLRDMLKWIKNEYGDIPIFITSNGYCGKRILKDVERVSYFEKSLVKLLEAINLDGCNVFGYTAFTLIDSFNWFEGYSAGFGLNAVDISDPKRKRTKKYSALFWTNLLEKIAQN